VASFIGDSLPIREILGIYSEGDTKGEENVKNCSGVFDENYRILGLLSRNLKGIWDGRECYSCTNLPCYTSNGSQLK
jgi:hypothetical protein